MVQGLGNRGGDIALSAGEALTSLASDTLNTSERTLKHFGIRAPQR